MKLDKHLGDIASGSHEALGKLFDEVAGSLFAIQLRLLKDHELAESALQETFYSIWQNAHAYNVQNIAPRAWLNSLARKQALDILRKARATAAPDTSRKSEVTMPDTVSSVDSWRQKALDYSDTMEEYDEMLECFRKLDRDAQACIVSLYCDGYTLETISQSLQHSPGFTRSRVRDGLSSLRECLNHGY